MASPATRVIGSVQHALAAQGVRGLSMLLRQLRLADGDGDGYLTFDELKQGLAAGGLRVFAHDARTLFVSVDADAREEVFVDDFVRALAGQVSPRRKALIGKIFDNIAGPHEQAVSLSDVEACFRADRHPDVEKGLSSPTRVLTDFMDALKESGTLRGGAVTREGLVDYYRLSAAFVSDNVFEAMLSAVWQSRPARKAVQTRLGDAVAQRAPGRENEALQRLREALRQRGVRGIVQLARACRAADRDRTGVIGERLFAQCVQSDVSAEDARVLFRAFDVDRCASIVVDDFLCALQGDMSARRLDLVALAFEALDRHGLGTVEPVAIVNRFDSSKHPDVLSGSRTADDVLREFLDTFDVGGIKDGKVTRAEFEGYYANVSWALDSDDFFELMMRNVWHLAGGAGKCANTANLRVKVTHADGSTSVECLEDDRGLSLPDDRAEVLRRLRTQGLDAHAVAELSDIAHLKAAPKPAWGEPLPVSVAPPVAQKQNMTLGDARDFAKADRDRALALRQSGLAAEAGVPPKVAAVSQRLRWRIKQLGDHGYHHLKRFLRDAGDGSTKLNVVEFAGALQDAGFGTSALDARAVFSHFDRRGTIDYNEFVSFLRGSMPPQRAALVLKAFEGIDVDGAGALAPDDVASKFDAAAHDDVARGIAKANEVYAAFMENFDLGSEEPGMVTANDFGAYYADVSANELSDARFDALVRGVWHVPGSARPVDVARICVTHADGRTSDHDLEIAQGLRNGGGLLNEREVLRRFELMGLDAIAADEVVDDAPLHATRAASRISERRGEAAGLHEDGQEAKPRPPSHGSMSTMHSFVANGPATLKADVEAGSTRLGSSLASAGSSWTHQRASSATQSSGDGAPPPGTALVCRRLSSELRERGVGGFVAWRRALQGHADESGKINLQAFKAAARDASLVSASDAELRSVFQHVDAQQGGAVSIRECVFAVRRPPSASRTALVALAFQSLDAGGRGTVPPSKLASTYDAPRHPDVISRRLTAATAYDDFVAAFDVGTHPKTGEACVGLAEFDAYHADVSAAMDDDSDFEALVRTVWKMDAHDTPMSAGASKRAFVAPMRKPDPAPAVHLDARLAGVVRALRADFVIGRGARGLVALERRLRAAATKHGGGKRDVILEDISTALKDCDAPLSAADAQALFEACSHGQGSVEWQHFLELVRPKLSKKRLEAVSAAWYRAFGASSSVLSQILVSRYSAAAHPDVLNGSATAQDVRNDFLATFDVGGDAPNTASFSEFEAYHVNIGAAVSDDDAFEVLVRCTWAAPEDASKMQAQARPLAALARCSKVDPSPSSVAGSQRGQRFGVADALSPLRSAVVPKAVVRRKPPPENVGVDHLLLDVRTQLSKRGASGIVGLARIFRAADDGSKAVNAAGFRIALKQQVDLTDAEMRALFNYFDAETGSVDYDDFLHRVRLPLSPQRLETVRKAFAVLDVHNAGAVEPHLIASNYDAASHPDVSRRRRSAEDVFREFLDTFDVGGDVDGKVTLQEFESYYTNVSLEFDDDAAFDAVLRRCWRIPGGDVVRESSTRLRVLVTHSDGSQTVESLHDDAGLVMPRDSREALRRLRAQGIDAVSIQKDDAATVSRPNPKTFREVSSTTAAGASATRQLHSERAHVDAPVPQASGAGAHGKMGSEKAHGFGSRAHVFGSQISLADAPKGARALPPPPPAKKLSPNDVFHSALGMDMVETRHRASTPAATSLGAASRKAGPQSLGAVSSRSGARDVVEQVRARLGALGARGISTLARDLRGHNSLSFADFDRCISSALGLDGDDVERLFSLFDRGGAVDANEVLCAMRGALNPRRASLVRRAFRSLDADGAGFVDVADVVDAYDSSRHPAVTAGLRDSDDVSREFLDTFDVGGLREGYVARSEFEEYYSNVSAGVDNDDYFDLVVRNAWHLNADGPADPRGDADAPSQRAASNTFRSTFIIG
ncbi:hypothetical protein M885DRAFT_621234 [Pelagophyceae sp. CCMP2097]|nr:hypothetical protein M885DRAFT_621234 [Pelagophyceae sp. CCMP2097]|mmetsp:Transcript_2152/g.7787  ORF Transcript_2152/g.7787 Transcript_2152/m.7787 type:complete len:1945 (-) Transcript_2152:101-5935(-)